MIANEGRFKGIEKTERPVVDGETEYRHIVRIEHAVGETDQLPFGDQAGGALGDSTQQVQIRVLSGCRVRVEMADDEIGQDLQFCVLLAVKKHFEVTETQMAGRCASQNRRGFGGFAIHWVRTAGDTERARARNAERGHGFATEEFTDGRTQHRAAITHARKRRQACAL